MSVLPILRWPDPRLSQVCAPVGLASQVHDLVRDMFDSMYDAPGRGLAAPQVGVMKRVFVMDAGWKTGAQTPRVCIDPVITQADPEMVSSDEACLSIPGVSASVMRHTEIILTYTDLTGARLVEPLTGFEALCAQHELDHLNGLVLFDRLPEAERAALIAEYEALA